MSNVGICAEELYYLTPGSGNVVVDESHIGGGEGDDAIGVEDVARVDRHDDAKDRQ